ncbi:MAG: prohibitin family protein [Clostridiales bacterium]|nr:prohibitin family protein [Clostridiales bacterium]
MFLVIIAFVLALVVFVATGFTGRSFKMNPKQFLALLPLLLIVFAAVAIVPANSVGIQYSPFSGVRENTLSEGWHFKGLFDEVYIISTEVQTRVIPGLTGQTEDAQYLEMVIDIKYRVNKERAFEVFRLYRTLENVSQSLIEPTVQRSIETITTQYNVIEILGEERNAVYTGIEEELTERLSKNGIDFISINFMDTDAGEAIEVAIQNEAVAKKEVETAQQRLEKVQIESQEKIIQSEAERDAAKIKAEMLLIEANAQAEANEILSKSLTPELLKKMEMDARMKWGWVTVYTGQAIVDVPQATE